MVFGNRLGFILEPALVGAGAAAWVLPVAVGIIVGAAAIAAVLMVRVTLSPGSDTVPEVGVP